jgi:hypothetical protein
MGKPLRRARAAPSVGLASASVREAHINYLGTALRAGTRLLRNSPANQKPISEPFESAGNRPGMMFTIAKLTLRSI